MAAYTGDASNSMIIVNGGFRAAGLLSNVLSTYPMTMTYSGESNTQSYIHPLQSFIGDSIPIFTDLPVTSTNLQAFTTYPKIP